MRRGGVQVVDFSKLLLTTHFGGSHYVEYLFEYLTSLSAASVVYEEHYVDRHFLDDFAKYYAKSFDTPDSCCSRIHFFEGLSKEALGKLVQEAFVSVAEHERVEQTLSKAYLGFVVKRPLTAAPIGRSVLKTYPIDGRRHYGVVRPYPVYIGSLRITVDGLAYQQQDRGAAVCASTALWVALQRIARVTGNRTPTPSAITQAAQSPYPASAGLDQMQMATALSTLGYSADAFAPRDNIPLFRARLVACVDSQLPVVLLLRKVQATPSGRTEVGHAVTVTGYSDPSSMLSVHHSSASVPPLILRGSVVDVIYVHDDNLGSHAHYELFQSSTVDYLGNPELSIRRGRTNKPAVPWWTPDEWTIVAALVPKPDKVRLSIDDLVSNLVDLRPLIESRVVPGLTLNYAVRFTTGIEYKRTLMNFPIAADDRRAFCLNTSLPRHLGVISAYYQALHLFDALIDVSEVTRNPRWPSVLAFVAPGLPATSSAGIHVQDIANHLGVPAIVSR